MAGLMVLSASTASLVRLIFCWSGSADASKQSPQNRPWRPQQLTAGIVCGLRWKIGKATSSRRLCTRATIWWTPVVIQLPTARIVFLRSLVFIVVVMMFAERGPTKSRHDFVEKQIKKDHSAYSSTRQITTERNIRRRTDLEVLPDVNSPRSEKGRARTRIPPTGVEPLNSTNGYMFPRIARKE